LSIKLTRNRSTSLGIMRGHPRQLQETSNRRKLTTFSAKDGWL
jgi:hypothetical protein